MYFYYICFKNILKPQMSIAYLTFNLILTKHGASFPIVGYCVCFLVQHLETLSQWSSYIVYHSKQFLQLSNRLLYVISHLGKNTVAKIWMLLNACISWRLKWVWHFSIMSTWVASLRTLINIWFFVAYRFQHLLLRTSCYYIRVHHTRSFGKITLSNRSKRNKFNLINLM